MEFPFDHLTYLIATRCNHDGDFLPMIRQRLYETRKRNTYRLRVDAQGRVVGFVDYDISHDGIVHLRKLIASSPGILWAMVRDLKSSLSWKRVYFYRALRGWRHHGKPWNLRHALA